MEKSRSLKKIIAVIILLVIAGVFVVATPKVITNETGFNKQVVESLDETKADVMKISGASLGISVIIEAIPGDIGSGIAEKLTDVTGYLLIVLSALFLEKYMLVILEQIALMIFIPLALCLLSIYVFKRNETLKMWAVKLVFFALALLLIIPSSVWLADGIEKAYKETTTTDIEEITSVEPINDSMKSTSTYVETIGKAKKANNSTIFADISNKMKKNLNKGKEYLEFAQNKLNQFIEYIAMLIVTSCLIPILMIILFGVIIRAIFGVDLRVSDRLKGARLSRALKKKSLSE